MSLQPAPKIVDIKGFQNKFHQNIMMNNTSQCHNCLDRNNNGWVELASRTKKQKISVLSMDKMAVAQDTWVLFKLNYNLLPLT